MNNNYSPPSFPFRNNNLTLSIILFVFLLLSNRKRSRLRRIVSIVHLPHIYEQPIIHLQSLLFILPFQQKQQTNPPYYLTASLPPHSADANSCTVKDLLTWNTKLGPECENNNHLDKGVALCVSISVNTAAAIAIANNDDPSSSLALDSSPTQDIINSSGSPSILAKPLSADSTTTVLPPPPSPQPIPSSPKSGTVIVVHDSSALASFTSSGLALAMGVVASAFVLL